MSLTINGTTNTLTAAAGLTVAGNTAVTGTLTAVSAALTTTSSVDGTTAVRGQVVATVGSAYAVQAVATGASGYANYGVWSSASGAVTLNYSFYGAAGSFYNAGDGTFGGAGSFGAGLAVTGTLSATGITSVTDVTDATSTTAASLKTAGGLAVVKKGYFGDNIVMASGKGIDFSATSDGSGTTTSEVFSDYEEGTFTPAVAGDSTAGTGTYTTQVGHYTKIGNRVFFSINLNWTAHTGTGNLKINGLPFTSANVSGLAHAVTATYINNLALSASNILTPYIGQNDSIIWLNQSPIGAGGSVTQVPMDTSAQLGLSGQYTV